MVAVAGAFTLLAPIALLATPAAAASDGGFDAFSNPGDTVTVEFPYRAEQYEWVVPDGVTEITVELAAGSGGRITVGDADGAVGGVGGHLIAQVPVDAGSPLFISVGARGTANSGGGATALATNSAVLAAAGGGGAGWAGGNCELIDYVCATGGAGGFSSQSGTSAGLDGADNSPLSEIIVNGVGATADAAGESRPEMSVTRNDDNDPVVEVSTPAVQPTPAPMSVTGGVISPAAGPVGDMFTGGGSGYFAGGHGASVDVQIFDQGDLASQIRYPGGGGGGSGYLAPGAEELELRDNVGDGFATISYTVPQPDVVDADGPELRLSAPTVRAGDAFTLLGAGFDPEREYPVILTSDAVLVGTVTTDGDGAFEAELTMPASVPAGERVLTVGDTSIPITVLAAAATDDAPPTELVADAAPELAATGVDPAAASILGLVAAALLAAGAAAVRASRQPHPVRQPQRQAHPTSRRP